MTMLQAIYRPPPQSLLISMLNSGIDIEKQSHFEALMGSTFSTLDEKFVNNYHLLDGCQKLEIEHIYVMLKILYTAMDIFETDTDKDLKDETDPSDNSLCGKRSKLYR